MSQVMVNVDNFARAESDRTCAAVQQQAGGVNRWFHYRAPTPVDQQTVIRMNRDTLYSGAVTFTCARGLRSQSRLRLEGRVRTLRGPSPALSLACINAPSTAR
jgi:hypothetical protein